MDRKYRRFQAALFIQRVWRGCACRGRISTLRYKVWRLINIYVKHYKPERAEERLQNSFKVLKEHQWLANAKDGIEKVILIQRRVREYIRNKPRHDEDAKMDEFEDRDEFGDVDDSGICEIRVANNNSVESPLENH